MRKAAGVVWGLYAWVIFCTLGVAATLIVAILPGLNRRRTVTKAAARAAFALFGAMPRVQHLERLPTRPCIIAANHCSYLDGVVLTAVLPARFSFVIKKEMVKVPLVNRLLQRIGSHFVDRRRQHNSALDARRFLRAAAGGQALAFFPEGTFGRDPGLRRFHTGAFVAAARSGWPVVPVAIRGTRTMLPAHSWLPRPAQIEVIVQNPVEVTASPNKPVNELRRETRRRILAVLNEPDLDPPESADRAPAPEVKGRAEA